MGFIFLILAFQFIRSHANFASIFLSSRFNSYRFLYSILLFTQTFVKISFLSPFLLPGVTSQTVEAKNGSLIWSIPGATLAFSATTADNHDIFSSNPSSVVTLHDLNTAINNSVATFEPQVKKVFCLCFVELQH